MKLQIEKSEITNPTLMHLEAWLLAIEEHLTDEKVFDDLDELATQLEQWRSEFCHREADIRTHWGDKVTVILYGEDVILISDQRSGEFIKVTEQNAQAIFPASAGKLQSIIKKAFAFLIVLFCISNPIQAESFWPIKKNTGLSVARYNQKQSVKLNKKNRKGLRKASRIVNARLSREGGQP